MYPSLIRNFNHIDQLVESDGKLYRFKSDTKTLHEMDGVNVSNEPSHSIQYMDELRRFKTDDRTIAASDVKTVDDLLLWAVSPNETVH